MKTINYVPCNRCDHWSSGERMVSVCQSCNNSLQVIDPKDILCNMCGGLMCPLGTHNEQIPHGLYNQMVSGGYDSYHLNDLVNYTFSFCEKCLREQFIKCKIPPTLTHQLVIECDNSWEADIMIYEYRLWVDNGGHHQAFLNKKCNEVKDCSNDAVYTKLQSGRDFSEESSCEEHKSMHLYSNCKFVPFISDVLKAFL